MQRLLKLSTPLGNQDSWDVYPHIMDTDFNITTWPSSFAEWTQEGEIWELLDPETPSFALGSAIDKFLFTPSHHAPSTFLPPAAMEQGAGGGDLGGTYYRAQAVNYPQLSDHSAIILRKPSHVPERSDRKACRTRVGNMGEEGWSGKTLAHRLPGRPHETVTVHINGYYGTTPGGLRDGVRRGEQGPQETSMARPAGALPAGAHRSSTNACPAHSAGDQPEEESRVPHATHQRRRMEGVPKDG